jgi:hypothetical protein
VNLSELVLKKGHVSISSLGFVIETGVLSYVLSERFTSSQNDMVALTNDMAAITDDAAAIKNGARSDLPLSCKYVRRPLRCVSMRLREQQATVKLPSVSHV